MNLATFRTFMGAGMLVLALVGLAALIAMIVLFRAASEPLGDVTDETITSLNNASTAMRSSSVAATQAAGALQAAGDGMNTSSEALGDVRSALTAVQSTSQDLEVLFTNMGTMLQEAGTGLSSTPSLNGSGERLVDAGLTARSIAGDARALTPLLNDIQNQVGTAKTAVESTTEHFPRVAQDLAKTGEDLEMTATSVNEAASQLAEMRESKTLYWLAIWAFVMFGAIDISLAFGGAALLIQGRRYEEYSL